MKDSQLTQNIDNRQSDKVSENNENLDTAYEPVAAHDSTKIAAAKHSPHWYILHTYSGYESIVKENLERVFEKNNLQERLLKITIPTV